MSLCCFNRLRLIAAIAVGVIASMSTAFAQNPSSDSTPDYGDPVYKSAATRLLAAMGPDMRMDAKVAYLIDRLTSPDRESFQSAVTALIMLGSPAVPAIIQRIDDRRKVPVGVIAIENRSPDAFEAVAQYGVATVLDCLNHILWVMTDQSEGFLDVGETLTPKIND